VIPLMKISVMELKVIALNSWKFDSMIMTQMPIISKLKRRACYDVDMDMDIEREARG